jgi:hypothetical protein
MAGQLLAFSSTDLLQTGLLRHPQAGRLGALEGRRLGALQALSEHFCAADRLGADGGLGARHAHRRNLFTLDIAGQVGLLGRLQRADQGLFLDRHCFLHSRFVFCLV